MNTQVATETNADKIVREIFLDDLDMPVASVRKIIAEMTGQTFTEEQVLLIKQDVEKRIARALPAVTHVAAPERFTNRPRLVVGKKNDVMTRRGRALVDVTEKRKWLNDWALEKGGMATIKEAKEALIKQFGEALGTSYIATTLKDARQLMLDERRRQKAESLPAEPQPALISIPSNPAQTPLRESIRTIASLMRLSGIRRISIEPDGSVSFEASTSA